MSYKIEVQSDRPNRPVIVCDQCGETIYDASEGSALWLEFGAADSARHDVKHAHDRCIEAFETTYPAGKGCAWIQDPIDHHMFRLAVNCGHDADTGRRQMLFAMA